MISNSKFDKWCHSVMKLSSNLLWAKCQLDKWCIEGRGVVGWEQASGRSGWCEVGRAREINASDLKWCLSIVLSSLSFPVLRVQIGPNRISDRSKLSHLTHSSATIISQLNVSFMITILSHQEVTQANCCIQLSNLWVGFNELNVVTKTQ